MSPIKTLIEKNNTEYFLRDINLEIQSGERIAVLGRNGSGKSTLCRLIASQLFFSSGSISNTFDVKLFSQIEQSFYKELSGRENLKYFMKFIYSDSNSTNREALVNNAVEFSELHQAIDRQVETYSSGMISRLALSLILAKKHNLLILDEIQSHADLNFRKKVSSRLKDVINSSDTVITVSHYLEEISETCERGIVLDGGRIIFDGNIVKAIAIYRLLGDSNV
jgi:ABC-type polysaccharide/polyol phosphate transport system ATPase subunit